MVIVSPVAGLRPVDDLRLLTAKGPMPAVGRGGRFECRMAVGTGAKVARGFCTWARSARQNGPRVKPRSGCFSTDGACRSVAGVLQGLAGLELRLIRRRDGHRFAGARVAAGRRLALADREGAEADETDFAALLQRGRDRVENGLDRLAGITLGQAARVSDGGDQVLFVHA